jgi:hypothetical protein
MPSIEFRVCRQRRQARWVVTVGKAVYGAYLDQEQALLDAVEAARDAIRRGGEAQVWLQVSGGDSRIL